MQYSLADAKMMVMISLNHDRDPSSEHRLVIFDEYTKEKPWGWIFYYWSERYRRTRDFRNEPVGAGPVYFNRFTGEIREYPSGRDLDQDVYDYEMEMLAKDGVWCLWLSDNQERKLTIVKLKGVLGITLAEAMKMVPTLPVCLFSGIRRDLDWMAYRMSASGINTHISVENSEDVASAKFCSS